MAKGDELHRIRELTISPGQQVRFEYDIGFEGAGGVFVKTSTGVKTMDWPEFVNQMGTIPKAGMKAFWDRSKVILSQDANLPIPLTGADMTESAD